jgi:hypothetical protein
LTKYCIAFIEKKTETSSPDAAATEAIIAAICSFSRVPETQTMWIFLDIGFLPPLWPQRKCIAGTAFSDACYLCQL